MLSTLACNTCSRTLSLTTQSPILLVRPLRSECPISCSHCQPRPTSPQSHVCDYPQHQAIATHPMSCSLCLRSTGKHCWAQNTFNSTGEYILMCLILDSTLWARASSSPVPCENASGETRYSISPPPTRALLKWHIQDAPRGCGLTQSAFVLELHITGMSLFCLLPKQDSAHT